MKETQSVAAFPRFERLASRFLAIAGALLALFVLIVVRSAQSRVGLILLVAAAALFASATVMPRRFRPGLMLVVIISTVGVWLGNAGLIVTAAAGANKDRQMRRDAAHTLGYDFDGRTRRDVILDATRAGQKLVPSIDPQGLLVDGAGQRRVSALTSNGQELLPLSGVSRVPTLLCNEVGRNVEYEADEHGFRNPANAWDQPADVLMVGDSFAHGVCVSEQETLTGLLRARGFRALLAAYSGNGPLLELATVKEYAEPVRPPVTVWALYEGNDLDDNLPREAMSPLLRRYLEQPDYRQNLFGRQEELDRILTRYVGEQLTQLTELDPQAQNKALSGLWDLSPLRNFFRQMQDRPQVDFALLERVLQAARQTVQTWNGQLVLLYLPAEDRWRGSGPLHRNAVQGWDGYHRNVQAVAQRLQIPFLDALPALQTRFQEGALLFYPFKAHYAAKGYEAASQALLDWLRAQPAWSKRRG